MKIKAIRVKWELVESLVADSTTRKITEAKSLKKTQGFDLTATAEAKYSDCISEVAGKVTANYSEMIETCESSSYEQVQKFAGK